MATQTLGGRYRLIEVLGRGAMGTVWKAHDENLDRTVAIKTITSLAEAPEASARLRREARSAASLANQHIAAVYDYGRDTDVDTDYVVMEMIAGSNLRQVVSESGSQSPETVARWGVQICQALAEAHSKGVYHRDLKPHNVMLTPDGNVKLVDFGIAAYAEADDYTRITLSGAMVGTPAYISPEQAQGQRIDHRSDLYSLGCALYELLTGRAPFTGPPMAVLLSHVKTEPMPPSTHRSELSLAWDALVLDLLAKIPEERPASAASVGARLTALTAPQFAMVPAAVKSLPSPLLGAQPVERDVPRESMSTPDGHVKGVVKWFNSEKGFGFLTADGGPDVFVHYSEIDIAGYRNLEEGQQVTFRINSGPKGPMAASVRPLD
ncbi:protein kinase [Streptomyces sp. NPDC056660]|uniref:protein kinase domain-containing protein n=1 Tax=Streptomyces sp. NPDC056660 TaxID=3345897 RepID=UPI0036CD1004